jgi:hypothetical protein
MRRIMQGAAAALALVAVNWATTPTPTGIPTGTAGATSNADPRRLNQ